MKKFLLSVGFLAAFCWGFSVPSQVSAQTASLVYGSNSGVPQAIKSTGGALWVSCSGCGGAIPDPLLVSTVQGVDFMGSPMGITFNGGSFLFNGGVNVGDDSDGSFQVYGATPDMGNGGGIVLQAGAANGGGGGGIDGNVQIFANGSVSPATRGTILIESGGRLSLLSDHENVILDADSGIIQFNSQSGGTLRETIDGVTHTLNQTEVLVWGSNGILTPDTGILRSAPAVLKITDAGAGYGTVDALGLKASGTPGVSCTVNAPAHLTVVNGIVTLCN